MNMDMQIRHEVERELFYSLGIKAAGIGVAVQDGIVTLTGTVADHPQKLEAVHAAERVLHVRAVACQLELQSPSPQEPTDKDLACAAANVLAWNRSVVADRLRIVVENGWVTLEGTVDWQQQKDAAAAAVAGINGVKGVDNLVNVNPAIAAEDVKEKIQAALKQSPAIEDRNVLVEVNGDRVVLHGQVRSMAEREEAERIAWSAADISDVANHIQVAEPVGARR